MTLRRKWLFYALNVLLPVLLVSALNSVVFALPVQCGEKMSVSLTTFLTLAVFMTLIQGSLPSNSDTVCYLVVYLVVDAIYVKPEDIWTPDMVLHNSVFPIDQLVKQKMRDSLPSNSDTVCYLTVYLASQMMELTQKLFTNRSLVVPPYSYNADSSFNPINLVKKQMMVVVNCTDTVLSLPEVQSAEWDITETSHRIKRSSGENGKSWHIVYTVKLRRKWLFYALNVLLPVLLVSGLNSVVFALPVQCGEKMSVSLTTFLTLAVFMTLIQDSLPSNSDTVCYLAVYLASQMVLSVAAVVVSAVTVACHHRQPKEENSTQNIRPMSSADATDSSATVADRSEVKPEAVDWQRLGVVIDRICFPVFTGLSVLSFLIYGIVTAL
nr:hypothetical protein BaRGS_003825 [Batillaria attramentaria]